MSMLNHSRPFPSEQPQVHTAFNRPPRLTLSFSGPGRTKQSFKDECDINIIMARYETSGVLEHMNRTEGRFLDTTQFDYQDAMLLVAEANSIFQQMPARLRDQFDNDPAKLLEFVHDPKNLAESVAMGFIDPTKLPPPKEAPKPAPGTSDGPGAPPASDKPKA